MRDELKLVNGDAHDADSANGRSLPALEGEFFHTVPDPPVLAYDDRELKLLVEWSSPWEEFRGAIRPALARSGPALAGEARSGLFPYRGMLASWAGEIVLFLFFLLVSRGMDTMRTYHPPPFQKSDVIYFSGDELPRTGDLGGASSGRSGRAGGREAFHHSQTIRVARGESLREKVVDAPKLDLHHSDAAVANLLAYKPVPGPPPAEGLKSSRPALQAPQMSAVAPSPELQRDEIQREQMRADPAFASAVIPPPPSAGQVTSLRLPGQNAVQVVPPPVSAPERDTKLNPKLTLPAQAVVAPPPQFATQLSRTGPGYGPGDLQKQVIPPPVQMGVATGEHRAVSGLGTNTTVVAPPVQVGAIGANRNSNGLGTSAVVAPPVQLGNVSGSSRNSTGLGSSAVVPPPVQVADGSFGRSSVSGLGTGSDVVPPAPNVSGGSLTGHGRGSRGAGFGGPGEMGDVAAPPNGGGTGGGTGIVVSAQPGSKIGVPNGGSGSLALSPNGGTKPGLGGSGNGNGIGRGNGPGSGFAGTGSGAGRDGTGRGSDPNARAGISPYNGPGGAGSGTNGTPALPGVSVRGGNGIVTLPSFSGDNASQPKDPRRSSLNSEDQGPGLTVVASARAGGAFNFYGALQGDKVYTIYIDTVLGTAVMQFADPTSAAHPYAQDLTAPQPLRADLPANVHRSRLVIACVLDRSGMVRNPRVIESSTPQMTAKVLAALPAWKFRPAMRGTQPVEVNAILGFDIDTSDHY